MKSLPKHFILLSCMVLLALIFAVATYFWGRAFQHNIQALSTQPQSSPLVERLNTTGYQQLFATPAPSPVPSASPSTSPSTVPTTTPSTSPSTVPTASPSTTPTASP